MQTSTLASLAPRHAIGSVPELRLDTWRDAQAGRWALWLPPCLVAGAVAELTATAEPPAWLGFVLSACCAVLAMALRRRRFLRMPVIACLAFALGVLSAQRATERAAPLLDVPRKAAIVTGAVSAVEILPQGVRLSIAHPVLQQAGQEAAAPATRLVRIRLRRGDMAQVASGDVVRVRAMLSPPSPPSFPGAWDLRRDAFFLGIGAYGFAIGPVEIVGSAPPVQFGEWLQQLREAITRRLKAALPPDQAAIAATLLTGSPSGISAADKAAFRDSGLAHILAIAGLHIGIVMGFIFGTVRLGLAAWEWAALRWPTKAIAACASLLAGGGYMLLTGAHVPIMRSFAMAALVTLAVLTGRRAVSLRGLGLAMAAIALIAPNEVMGVSFQMSFSAVLALIAGYEALRPWLRRLRGDGSAGRRIAGHVLALALTSAFAGTASEPYAMYHFGHIQLYYIVANMAAVPLTALWVLPLGLVALALMPFGLEALALVPMGWGEAAILWIGRSVASLPAAVVATPAPSPAGLVVMSLGLAWLGLWRGRVRLAGVPLIACGVASAWLVQPPDVLVSPDARLIAVRTGAGLFVEAQSGASAFSRDSWRQAWADGDLQDLPWQGAAGGTIACDAQKCLAASRFGPPVWIARSDPGPEACGAALILAAEPVRLRCPHTPVIDRFSVWRQGAHAVWLGTDGPTILTARAVTGERPWAPPPHRARAASDLPLAIAE